MSAHRESFVKTPAPATFGDRTVLSQEAVDRAVVRGRKMQSEAFWTMLRAIARLVRKAVAAVAEYRRTQRAVAELRSLDRHMLADIGLDRGDIERVARWGHERTSAALRGPVANDASGARHAA